MFSPNLTRAILILFLISGVWAGIVECGMEARPLHEFNTKLKRWELSTSVRLESSLDSLHHSVCLWRLGPIPDPRQGLL